MIDFLAAIGLVLAIEGIAFAAFPAAVKRSMAQAAESPPDLLRVIGLVSAVVGVALIWLVRAVLR